MTPSTRSKMQEIPHLPACLRRRSFGLARRSFGLARRSFGLARRSFAFFQLPKAISREGSAVPFQSTRSSIRLWVLFAPQLQGSARRSSPVQSRRSCRVPLAAAAGFRSPQLSSSKSPQRSPIRLWVLFAPQLQGSARRSGLPSGFGSCSRRSGLQILVENIARP